MFRYVDDLDGALDLRDWFERQPYVALDTETSGLDVHDPNFHVRLIQFGNKNDAWVMDCENWLGFIKGLLKSYRGRIIGHNIGGYDSAALRAVGIMLPWEKVDDTLIAMRLAQPHRNAALKDVTARLISPKAAESQDQLHRAMKKHGWGWDTVPHDLPEYRFYAGMDVILNSRLYEHEICQRGLQSPVYEMEMDVRAICSEMEWAGMRVNVPFAMETAQRLRREASDLAEEIHSAYGFSISSGPQLARWLLERGVKLSVMTGGGAPSVSKDALEAARYSATGEAADVMDAVLRSRKIVKLASTYFDSFVDKSTDGLLHPQIQTVQARTMRMCIPTSHGILTNRGVLTVDQIAIGDMTIDRNGEWSSITAVHQYGDQPTIKWVTSRREFECTEEHKWVLRTEPNRKGTVTEALEPFSDKRRFAQLAPDVSYNFESRLRYETWGEKISTLIGLLVSDGRCHGGYQTGDSLIGRIYQDEKKFYTEICEFIQSLPDEATMLDRVTANGDNHHEIALRARWLRPVLESCGFYLEKNMLLRTNYDLASWVISLPLNEVESFFRAVWISDGTTAHPQNKKISCASKTLQHALQIAGYRLGWTSYITSEPPSSWGTKNRESVKFTKAIFGTRDAVQTPGRSDVWCVSTSSGTFTAWDARGPYLTGNSITNPAMQTLPRTSEDPDSRLVRQAIIPRKENHYLISSDFSQIELRIIASLSQDAGLMEAFQTADTTGEDIFTTSMRLVYGDPSLQKTDPKRTLIKNFMYAFSYGAGTAKMAATAKVSVEEMRAVSDAVVGRFSGIKRYMKVCEKEALSNDNWITTPFGRRIWVDPDHSYKALNAKVQGYAGDIFKQTMVNLANAGLVDYMVCPIHDEVLFSVPEEDLEDVSHTIAEVMPYHDLAVAVPADPSPGVKDWSQAK